MSLRDGNHLAVEQALKDIKASTRATAVLLDTLMECVRADSTEHRDLIAPFPLDELLSEIGRRLEGLASQKSLSLRVSSRGA